MKAATLFAQLFAFAFVIALSLNYSLAQEGTETAGNQDDVVDAGVVFFLDLAQNQKVEGVAVDVQKFKITTGFGDVEVPLDKIDGIRLNAMEDGSAVMAFKNGDVLTGVLHVNDLKLKTSWGFATVNIAYIEQISTTKGAVFSSTTADGKTTWRFTRGTNN